MKEGKIVLSIILAAILIFLIIFFALPTPKTPNIPMPWKAYNQQGITTIFGLEMEKSTLKNAMQIFGTEAEVSIFKEKNKQNDLEVYFYSTKIGGLSITVILNLIADKNTLELLNKNIKNYEKMPTGNEKVEFNDFAKNQLLNNKIKNLSFIPRTTLDDKTILIRFGKPTKKTKSAWYYPQQGLKIVRDGKLNIFEYSNSK